MALEARAQKVEAEKEMAVAGLDPGGAAGASSSVGVSGSSGRVSSPVEALSLESYVFKARAVPLPPDFLRSENSRLLVSRDEESNSWVWMGTPALSCQIKVLAELSDKGQTEIDLDFVLVLLSEDDLRQFGVSAFYDEGASWLSMLSLQGDSGSLRIASGSWGLELNAGADVSSVVVLSRPVIRCLSGAPFEFSTDSEIPIPQTQIYEGTVKNSVDYRTVGFSVAGSCVVVGERLRLQLDQRNGSVKNRSVSTDSTMPSAPEIAVQKLKSSCFLSWWEWSPVGGLQVDREEISKGWFKRKNEKSRDYLVIFARPRDALKCPPRAFPPSLAGEMSSSENGLLLPPLGALDDNGAGLPWIDDDTPAESVARTRPPAVRRSAAVPSSLAPLAPFRKPRFFGPGRKF